MKNVLGIVLIVGGVVFGLYVGFYLMFFKGLVLVIEAVKATPIISGDLAWGVVKMLSATIVGAFSGLVLVATGKGMLD